MKTKLKNINGCSRIIEIEISTEEMKQAFDQVYMQIRKTARIAGFRPGHAPRDLLETHYGKMAEEEVIKQTIPEYYLRAVKEEQLDPVVAPEIENVRLNNLALCFSAKIDVRPKLKLKSYKNLRIVKKKARVEQTQIEQVLEKLRKSHSKKEKETKSKEKAETVIDLDDQLTKDLGFNTIADLKAAIKKNLQANAELKMKVDMERQLLEQLLARASLDVPQSLVNSQMQELIRQLKLNPIKQQDRKQDEQTKEKALQQEARKEAIRRVKLFFILEEIAQRENIQVEEKDLDEKMTGISQRLGKNRDEVKQYLHKQNLIPRLKAELKDEKTMQFMLREAKIEEVET